MKKKIIATTSLAGCFGCHMSILDIDERILGLAKVVEFNKSPIDDIKRFTKHCDIGIVEGGCANNENVIVLREFRKNCSVLISMGECAIMGGLPAMRNGIPVRECLEQAYLKFPSVSANSELLIPNDEELPVLLDRVYPCHEVVKMDYYIPGCPPHADLIWEALNALITGNPAALPYEVFKYD